MSGLRTDSDTAKTFKSFAPIPNLSALRTSPPPPENLLGCSRLPRRSEPSDQEIRAIGQPIRLIGIPEVPLVWCGFKMLTIHKLDTKASRGSWNVVCFEISSRFGR